MAGEVWPQRGYWARTIQALDRGVDIIEGTAKTLSASSHTEKAQRLRDALNAINDVRQQCVLDQHDSDRKASHD